MKSPAEEWEEKARIFYKQKGELELENMVLRMQLSGMHLVYGIVRNREDELEAQKTKLRDLCSKLLDVINILCFQQRHCLECELNGQPLCKLAKLFHEAHELGIEVK